MAKKGVIALLSCVFALSLALVGCGGNNAEAAKAAFAGTWDLVEMSQNGEVTGSEDLETLKSLGLEVYVNLNEDGTSALVLFGETIDGTWEATSTTEGKITMEGQDVSMKIEDSKLTFEQEGATLTFEKGEAKETPSSSSDEESANESAEGDDAADENSDESAEGEDAADENSDGSESASSGSESSAAEESSSSSAAE